MLRIITLVLITFLCAQISAQEELRADSLIVNQMRKRGVSFSNDNEVILLTSGQDKFEDMFKAIEQAEHSIHMEYFNFRNDSIANRLFDLLAVKAKQGVEVRLLFDAFGNASNNQPLKNSHLKKIRNNGIQIYKFDPIIFPWVNHVFSRDHRKIVIIDGQMAYTGGMNVADYYINGTKEVGEWHDMHCRISGSEVNTLQHIFLNAWQKVTKEKITGSRYFRGGIESNITGLKTDSCHNAGKKLVGIINREPRKTNTIIRDFYIQSINHAQRNIRIVNPYFTLSNKLTKALKEAVKRGVKVDIMLSVRSDIPLTPDCGYYNAHKLMKAGCNIWLYKPGFHHAKIMMVDGMFCTVGSANLNARSLRFDYEENALIVDSCTTKQLNDLFDEQQKDSYLLTPDTWNEFRTGWQKFRGWFAHLLAPVL